MIKEQLEQKLVESGKVEFKLYSLEYTIELSNEQYIIYANYYKGKKATYNTLKELLNNYTVYNESIMENYSPEMFKKNMIARHGNYWPEYMEELFDKNYESPVYGFNISSSKKIK